MDETAVLAALAVLTALNTVVILVLAVATVRSRPGVRGRAATAARIGLAEEPVVGTAAGVADGADPLAGAISAFLTRPDGLFRAGGPTGAVPLANVGLPAGAAPPASMAPASSVVQPAPPVAPAPVWAPSRPVRYVASAPRPLGRPPSVEPAAAAPSGALAASTRPVAPVPRPMMPMTPAPSPPATHPASRVSVWFVGRDASRTSVQPGAVARLGPVIGGLLRERTRAEDRVAVEAGGRFAVTLADTPVDGAAALTRRLAHSCDAWLAAEEPPLRLEFGVTELAVATRSLPGRPDRGSGPERRRSVPLDV